MHISQNFLLRNLRSLLLSIGMVSPAFAEYTINAEYGLDYATRPPTQRLKVDVSADGKYEENGSVKVDTASLSPANYVVQFVKNDNPTAVKVSKITPLGTGYVSVFIIHFENGVKVRTDGKYLVEVKNWKMRDGSKFSGKSAPSNQGAGKYNDAYLTNRYEFERKAQVQSGSAGGAVSLKWSYITGDDPYAHGNDWQWKFALKGKADFVLPKEKRFDFFNGLGAEADLYVQTPWPENPSAAVRVFADLGANVEYNVDQDFSNMEIASGAYVRAIVGNPLTDWLSSHPLIGKGPAAAMSPAITIKYQGVHEIEANADKQEVTGDQRLTVQAFWRWPLGRDIHWFKPLGIEGAYDLDLIGEFETNLDIDSGDWVDNSRATLEFSPVEGGTDSKKPSFTLTYARGQAKPTFKQFDAFLAGFKIPF